MDPCSPAASSNSDSKKVPFYITRKQALRALGVGPTAIRVWETDLDDPIIRYKKGREVYYEIQELFKWYHRKLVKAEGSAGRPIGSIAGEEQPEQPKQKKGINEEKTRLTSAQAEAVELKNKVSRRELAPIQLLEDALADLGAQISSILSSIPSRLRKKYSWLKASQLDEIEAEIIKAQNAASECRLDLPERPPELADVTTHQSANSDAIIGLEGSASDQGIGLGQ